MHEARANERIFEEVMALWGTGRQVEPFSRRFPSFALSDAYEVVARVGRLRRSRGEIPVGRKVGFTNRSIWSDHGIAAPIWNYVFDKTVVGAADGLGRVALNGMAEPRIEPEIVLHLASPPAPGMTAIDLLECIDWVAPAFEIVFSIFPGWRFTAADAAAAFGVHGALVVGGSLRVGQAKSELAAQLRTFAVELSSDTGVRRQGRAANVLGGPLEALKFLIDEIARYPVCQPLEAGELVTTGTLTEAMAVKPGETWRARFDGIALGPLEIGLG